MNLADRSRAVSRAGKGTEAWQLFVAAGGVGALGLGWTIGSLPLVASAALVIGSVLGRALTNADRLYMEGFADGLVYAPENGAPAAGHGGSTAPDLRRLSGGPDDNDPGAADGRAYPDQRGSRAAAPVGAGINDLAAAFRVHLEDRPSRPALTEQGDPITLAQGPGRVGFPAVPAAEPSGSPVRLPREASRPASRRRSRPVKR